MKTRRQFLIMLARGLAVFGIGLGAYQLFAPRALKIGASACIQVKERQGICSVCQISQSCSQPQAISYRRGP